ncbi:MAG: efflux RND transporter periplasmic adaptor subunit [Sphingobacteriia bacterium]|nr:efflux RND transporter periplasmic adaptor subunit [Sphingobacteriia bacterium]
MKKIGFPLIFILIVVLVIIGKFIFSESESANAGANTKTSNLKSPVKVEGIVLQPITLSEDLYLLGSLKAQEEVLITSEINGRIIQLNIPDGGNVKKGDILVQLNNQELSAQLEKAKAQTQLLKQKEERLKSLVKVQGISEEEYQSAQAALSVALSEEQLIQAQLAKLTIRAPFDGKLGLRSMSNGAYVSAGSPIATLQQIIPLKVDFSVPEKYQQMVKPGAKVKFTVEGIKDTLVAKVMATENEINSTTRSLGVRALCFPPTGITLLPGAFAKIILELLQKSDALLVPTQAIIPILKGQKVFITENGVAAERKVITGVRTDEKIEILEGIQIGDTIITAGYMSLKPGTPVQVTLKGFK